LRDFSLTNNFFSPSDITAFVDVKDFLVNHHGSVICTCMAWASPGRRLFPVQGSIISPLSMPIRFILSGL
jgi:hypothetical protein